MSPDSLHTTSSAHGFGRARRPGWWAPRERAQGERQGSIHRQSCGVATARERRRGRGQGGANGTEKWRVGASSCPRPPVRRRRRCASWPCESVSGCCCVEPPGLGSTLLLSAAAQPWCPRAQGRRAPRVPEVEVGTARALGKLSRTPARHRTRTGGACCPPVLSCRGGGKGKHREQAVGGGAGGAGAPFYRRVYALAHSSAAPGA